MADQASAKEMGVFGRLIGIFTSPRETFESIDKKPGWIFPLLLSIVIAVVGMYLTTDINMKDQEAAIQHRMSTGQLSEAQIQQYEASREMGQGIGRYMSLIFMPIYMVILALIWAGIYLFTGKTIMGGDSSFKKVFSVVNWAGLIGIAGFILNRVLVVMKGTNQGVTTSLAAVLPAPQMGETPGMLYRILARFDLFRLIELFILIIGFAVIFRFTTRKSSTMVISVWAVWSLLAVVLGQLLGNMFGM